MRLGLKVNKVHRILESNQSQWLKQCIEFNTQKRREAEKNREKDENALYKLMNNAGYGKTMRNLRNRIDVRLVNNEKDYLRCLSKPKLFVARKFDNNLVAIHKSKVSLKLNKPEYSGMCILELSKILMYKCHYDYIENKHDNK